MTRTYMCRLRWITGPLTVIVFSNHTTYLPMIDADRELVKGFQPHHWFECFWGLNVVLLLRAAGGAVSYLTTWCRHLISILKKDVLVRRLSESD